MKAARFYVYELFDASGVVVYVGKGSGARLQVQKRRRGLDGREVARFWRERDAYAFEVQRIAEFRPALNRHPGGNGCRVARRGKRVPGWIAEIERGMRDLGSERYVARMLYERYRHLVDPRLLPDVRRVAYG